MADGVVQVQGGSTRRVRFGAALAGLGLLAALLGGCGGLSLFPGIKATTLELQATTDANRNSPVAVDVVVAYDEQTLARIASLPAAEWFQGREQLKRDAAGQIRTVELEMVPGSRREVDLKALGRYRAVGGVLFAGYLTPGAHRLRIDRLDPLHIVLGRDEFSVQSP